MDKESFPIIYQIIENIHGQQCENLLTIEDFEEASR